jgi:phosphopantothenoylcysteine decarboxylase / phosphopantothenate---cysteine ligase
MAVLPGKHIVLGITGSIAAFKAAELASQLAQMGAQLDVILTPAAEKFITPLTLQSVTGRHAFTEADLWGGEAHVLHVGLGHTADLLVIAPCTANTLAKLAHGEADNLLTITALAARCPLLLAPAMDGGMLDHPATRANLDTLLRRGAYIAGPAEGHLASGLLGKGRLVEPAELIGHIRLVLGRKGSLASKKVVISAGGTQEPLDPVRVLTNNSSGKQGYALAQAAIDSGADVTLISAPTALIPPVGARILRVQTAREMLDAVRSESAEADVLIMAAAVADFRPTHTAADKLKSRDGVPHIELEATEDILKAVASMKHSPEPTTGAVQASAKTPRESLVPEPFDVRGPRLLVGFAAESRDLMENAAEKLKSKQLNLIVANDITAKDAGFGADTNRVTIMHENGDRDSLPLMSKAEVADAIIERIAALLE